MDGETQFFEFMERYRPYDSQFYHDFTTLKVTGYAPDQAIRRYYGVHTTLTTAGMYRENILLAVRNCSWRLALENLKLLAESKNVDLKMNQITSREERVNLSERMKEINSLNNSKEEKLVILRSIAQRAEELDGLDIISTEEINEEIESIETRLFTNQIPISDLSFNFTRLDKFKFEAEKRKNVSVNQSKYVVPAFALHQKSCNNKTHINGSVNGFANKLSDQNNKMREAVNSKAWNEAELTIPHLISKAHISKPKLKPQKIIKFQNSLNIKLQKSPFKKKKEYRYLYFESECVNYIKN